jgi:acetyltransferase
VDAVIEIAELAPAQRAVIAFVFARLGERSRQQRFLAVRPRLGERELERLARVDHWHREALVAWAPAPRRPVAVARYARGAEFDRAELAVVVADEWQRLGVGRALVRALASRALAAGIRRFSFTALAGNRGALALAGELGVLRHVRTSAGVTELVVELAPAVL